MERDYEFKSSEEHDAYEEHDGYEFGNYDEDFEWTEEDSWDALADGCVVICLPILGCSMQ